jgi:acyl-CoA thioester hydrolase
VWSELETRRGIRLRWHSRFLGPTGLLAAAARVELVLVDLSRSPSRRLVRRYPAELEEALGALFREPEPASHP